MNILYILPSYNVYGGTPKKTLDLLDSIKSEGSVYVYANDHVECKNLFLKSGANVYDGFYGRNIFRHVINILKIVDENKIDIIQTQFSMGELLGLLIKIMRPRVKLIVAFVGPFRPSRLKMVFCRIAYGFADYFVYVSKYIQAEKIRQFPLLNKKPGCVVFNGASLRELNPGLAETFRHPALLTVSGLIPWKNVSILIDAMQLIKGMKLPNDIFLYVAGDGPQRRFLVDKINSMNLQDNVFLLGYRGDIPDLLNQCDIYLHPSCNEGFGIAVAEAMISSKPVIVSNSGALPELVVDGESGLVVDPHNPMEWAEAIFRIIEDNQLRSKLEVNAKIRAESNFSVSSYISQYMAIYKSLVN